MNGGWERFAHDLPSGKHTKNYGKSPFSMGKSTINGPFSIANCEFTRGYITGYITNHDISHYIPAR